MAREFFGARLRGARVARGMTASVLAERIGISPGAISQHESGVAEPRGQTLSHYSGVLEMPEVYFYRPGVAPDPSPYWYRSRAAATKRARDSAEARYLWLRDVVSTLEGYVTLPQAQIDSYSHTDPMKIRVEDIVESAESVRTRWKLGDGPVPNVVSLLENMGCVVASFAFGAETLSAFSQSPSERQYVLLNADEGACVRQRFNAAHELGHLILHRNIPVGTAANATTYRVMEEQAHQFASELLFPASVIADEIYSIAIDSLPSREGQMEDVDPDDPYATARSRNHQPGQIRRRVQGHQHQETSQGRTP